MSIEYCEQCDWEWDSDKHEACSKCHGEPADDEPSETDLQDMAYGDTSIYEVHDRLERELRETGRR